MISYTTNQSENYKTNNT